MTTFVKGRAYRHRYGHAGIFSPTDYEDTYFVFTGAIGAEDCNADGSWRTKYDDVSYYWLTEIPEWEEV